MDSFILRTCGASFCRFIRTGGLVDGRTTLELAITATSDYSGSP